MQKLTWGQVNFYRIDLNGTKYFILTNLPPNKHIIKFRNRF